MKFLINLFIISLLTSCMASKNIVNNRTYALRLRPNQDLKQEIVAFAQAHHIQAGYIITCVGSLKKASYVSPINLMQRLWRINLKSFLSLGRSVTTVAFIYMLPFQTAWAKQ
jgi:hypothetical protein